MVAILNIRRDVEDPFYRYKFRPICQFLSRETDIESGCLNCCVRLRVVEMASRLSSRTWRMLRKRFVDLLLVRIDHLHLPP